MSAAQQHSPEQTAVFDILNQHLGDNAAGYAEAARWKAAQKLLEADYTTEFALRTATREGLREAGVAPALVDAILATAGGAAAGQVVVRVKTGRKEKLFKVATSNGQVSLLPLERDLNVIFERVAVKASDSDGGSATSTPAFKDFNNYNMDVHPGQELIVEAKPTGAGGNWLVRAMGL